MATATNSRDSSTISTSVHGFKYFVGSDSTADRFIKLSDNYSQPSKSCESTTPPDNLKTGTDD
jgi:hypothetical protein